MTNVRLLLVVWLCTLVPAAARADDGGWYEWLQKMSGPTLMGFGSDIHLVCIDKDARAFNCAGRPGHSVLMLTAYRRYATLL